MASEKTPKFKPGDIVTVANDPEVSGVSQWFESYQGEVLDSYPIGDTFRYTIACIPAEYPGDCTDTPEAMMTLNQSSSL